MVRPVHPRNLIETNTLKVIKSPRGPRKSLSHKDNAKPSESKNAARERCRVENLRNAFASLQQCLPSVPPNTKLSKLDVLILATTYISHLSRILSEDSAITENSMDILSSDFDLFEGTLIPPPEPEIKNPNWEKSYLHPVRKWPMRSRLYAGVEENESSDYGLPPPVFHKTLWS